MHGPPLTLTMNPALDVSTALEQVVADSKLRCEAPRREPGGGGINVARALVALGGSATALYPAGGPTGVRLTALLQAAGIDARAQPIAGETRESFSVTETSSNRQYRFVLPGPTLSEPEWSSCLTALRELSPPPEIVVASGSLPSGLPSDFFALVAAIGDEIGARVLVDTSGEPLRRALAAGVYLVKPNLGELAALLGRVPEDDAALVDAGRELLVAGGGTALVVSLGIGGALLVTAESSERIASPTVPIRSRIGAGDSMMAGIVLGLARGEPLSAAVRRGVAAGAAAVMTPGSELCHGAAAERLYAVMTEPAAGGGC